MTVAVEDPERATVVRPARITRHLAVRWPGSVFRPGLVETLSIDPGLDTASAESAGRGSPS